MILIAGIAFVNYILLRLLGPRGMEITAFFGGLINSRKVIVEFMLRSAHNSEALAPVVFRGIMLATSAMAVRNAIILATISHSREATYLSLAPLGFMFLLSVALWRLNPVVKDELGVQHLELDSPFSLSAALKFGLVFLVLNIIGALAERRFGSSSFYFVSLAGGLLSSGSSIASTATLIRHGDIPTVVGVNGMVISSLTSVVINIPLVRRIGGTPALRRKITISLIGITLAGLAGMAVSLSWSYFNFR